MSKSNNAASSSQGRCEKRVAELDAEFAAEFSALTEAKGRLQRLEAEQAAATSLPEPSAPFISFSRVCQDCSLEGQTRRGRRRERRCDPESVEQAAGDHVFCGKCKRRSANAHDQSSQRVERVVAGKPRGQALFAGNESRVMELSSRLSDGAAKMSELMGVMVP